MGKPRRDTSITPSVTLQQVVQRVFLLYMMFCWFYMMWYSSVIEGGNHSRLRRVVTDQIDIVSVYKALLAPLIGEMGCLLFM